MSCFFVRFWCTLNGLHLVFVSVCPLLPCIYVYNCVYVYIYIYCKHWDAFHFLFLSGTDISCQVLTFSHTPAPQGGSLAQAKTTRCSPRSVPLRWGLGFPVVRDVDSHWADCIYITCICCGIPFWIFCADWTPVFYFLQNPSGLGRGQSFCKGSKL